MSRYHSLRAAYAALEPYVPAVTLPLSEWASYPNTLYGDAVVPGGTSMDGAVYTGHVSQNAETAMLPYPRRRRWYYPPQ